MNHPIIAGIAAALVIIASAAFFRLRAVASECRGETSWFDLDGASQKQVLSASSNVLGASLHRLLFIAAPLLLLMLPHSVVAEDSSGFYAGIYATGGPRNVSDFEEVSVFGIARDPDVEPAPAVSNPGFRPELFQPFQDGMINYPAATSLAFSSAGIQGLMTSGLGAGSGVVLGYALGNGFRVEADVSSLTFAARSTENDTTTYANGVAQLDNGVWDWTYLFEDQGTTSFAGDLTELVYGGRLLTTTAFFLFNGFYDFGSAEGITPYLGGGIGVALVSSHSQFQPVCGCVSGYSVDSSAVVPAAQLGAGMRIPIGDPITLDIGYRYKVAGSSELTSTQIQPDLGEGDSFSSVVYRQSGMIGIHSIQAGFTFAFE